MILFHNDFGSLLPSNYCNRNLKIVRLAPDVTILSFLIESFNHLRISAPLSHLGKYSSVQMFSFWEDRCEMWHQAGLDSGDQRFLIWTIWENLVSGNLWLMGNTSNNCGNLGGTQQSLYPLPTHTFIKMYNISKKYCIIQKKYSQYVLLVLM